MKILIFSVDCINVAKTFYSSKIIYIFLYTCILISKPCSSFENMIACLSFREKICLIQRGPLFSESTRNYLR